jgi:hypothetical protein
MFKANKNVVGLNKHLNKGGLVKEWVHQCSNYDVAGNKLVKVEGKAGAQWKVEVAKFGAQMLEMVKGNQNEQAVNAWLQAHLAR